MDDIKKYINDLRHDFSLKHLNELTIEQNPYDQFEVWLKEAMQAQLPDPNAMILSTASAKGKPSGRVLLLRDFGSEGFVFYTNYNSRKGKELEENPYASMTFFWQQLERQVRIEGKLDKLTPDLSDKYFQSRPRESQIGAWASSQSEKIESRVVLDEKTKHYEEKFLHKDIPRPGYWGGFSLKAETVEFWQGRPGRLHDRLVFLKIQEGWKISRLSP